MAVVALNIDKFRAMFPGKFENPPYSDDVLEAYFTRAELYINNGGCSRVPQPPRESLLYLTMAHLMTLYKPDSDGGTVGRVSSASQGNVSVGLDYPVVQNGAWWNQTQYGAEVWVLTAKYRSFVWVPGARRGRLWR